MQKAHLKFLLGECGAHSSVTSTYSRSQSLGPVGTGARVDFPWKVFWQLASS